MVEISMFGSGEGPVWATGRGYSTGTLISYMASMRVMISAKNSFDQISKAR